METSYNYSEYSQIANFKKTYTSSCKAVKLGLGDLFIISDIDDDTEDGKELATSIADYIISNLSKQNKKNQFDILQKILLEAQESVNGTTNFNTNDVSISVMLLSDNDFYVHKLGKNKLYLHTDKKLYELSNGQIKGLQLKEGDVLLSTSQGLPNVVTDESINAEFNSDESVAQKTKNLLDAALANNVKEDVSIQTLEITTSKYKESVFDTADETLTSTEPVTQDIKDEIILDPEFADETINTEVDNKITSEVEEKLEVKNDLTENTSDLTEEANDSKEDVNDFDKLKSDKVDKDVDELEEQHEEEVIAKKGFSVKKALYILLPLLLIAAAIKYYPLLTKEADPIEINTDILTESNTVVNNDIVAIDSTENLDVNLSTIDTTATTAATNTTDDTVNTTAKTVDTNIQKTTQTTQARTNRKFFILGDNNLTNNTYKTIYQYTINSNTSLSIDDIIALNPDYKNKHDGDKIYLN